MTDFTFYRPNEIPDDRIQIAVVAARYQGKWVFCRHRQRTTWEMPGGHKEQGETVEAAAKRELFEETGAVGFEITPVLVCCDRNLCGMLYYADITKLGSIPPGSEMAEIKLFERLPEQLTYPDLYRALFASAESWLDAQTGSGEIWDVYDKYRNFTGRFHLRGTPLEDGEYHLVVHVWVRNRRGEYLISQRSATRPTFPLMWECVGGSVLSGENSAEGAAREALEEIGITLDPAAGRKVFSKIRGVIDRVPFHDIMDVWLFEYDGEPMLESATTDEVADCRWMTPEEIRTLYDDGKLVHTLDYFFCAFGQGDPDYRGIIGKTVSGKIDRPLGSPHPKYPDTVYPVNYGYVEGVTAADGKEQDVYVFGAAGPLETFEGKVIRVFHRFNDAEDKWIVSLGGEDIPDDKILGDIAFSEQFFYGKLYP